MKKLPLAFCLCVFATPALAADWTPHLMGKSNICDTQIDLYAGKDGLPKALRGDVQKVTALIDEDGYKYQLKNATFLGYPLTKIEAGSSGDVGGTSFQFKTFDTKKMLAKAGFKDSKGKILSAGGKQAFLVKEVQNETTYEYTYTFVQSLPYPKLKKYDDDSLMAHFAKKYATKANADKALLFSTPTGWAYYSPDYVTSFKVNKKDNSISCFSYGGSGGWNTN